MIHISKWIENHMSWFVTIGLSSMIVLVGYYVYLTMITDLKEHPEIKEIGPPGVTNLGPVTLCVLVSVLVIEIVMWLCKPSKTP